MLAKTFVKLLPLLQVGDRSWQLDWLKDKMLVTEAKRIEKLWVYMCLCACVCLC